MLYGYECQSCGTYHEVRCSVSEYKSTSPCECGEVASRVWTVPQVIVRKNERSFSLDGTDLPIGWEHGNTDPDKQEARYKKMIAEERKNARLNDKAAIKGGIRKVASVPREYHRKLQKEYGKDFWASDTREKLKEAGLYHHNDG